MVRSNVNSPVEELLQEARSIEVLLSDLVPGAEDIETYWSISADMIHLMSAIEGLAVGDKMAAADESFVQARKELSRIESIALELSQHAELE